MKKNFIYMAILLMASTLTLSAQKNVYVSTLDFDTPRVEKTGDRLVMTAQVSLNDPEFHRQQMVTLTPVLRSLDGTHRMVYNPVVFLGKKRAKVVDREIRLNNFVYERQPYQMVVHDPRGTIEPVTFVLDTPYEPWMRNAELVFEEHVTGCGDRTVADNLHRSISPILSPVYHPTYEVTYVVPPAEMEKQRSESYAARINFRVSRYEILHDYMNNAQVLGEVDRIVNEVKNDPNLTITRFSVTGYASPEGTAASNMTLSENRARSFVKYVQDKHGLSQDMMQVDWRGDDWDGLRRLMQESNFHGRTQVLDILNGTTDPVQRKNRLKALGTTYRELLNDYYPQLRRNEYTIAYVARPFSVEEAKTIIRTKPQQLSLNEMFLVANTYPKDSPEFKEVFDIAARLYPDNDYANLNSAALDIENGAYDVALERLQKVNKPEAWNNIGYVYVKKGDYTRAAEYFRRAAAAGNAVAAKNLRELDRWMENPE